MARRRAARTLPDWMVYKKAKDARTSVFHVIVVKNEKDKDTGEDIMVASDGSSFVIKVNPEANETILLTCAHLFFGDLVPDTLCVRRMAGKGVRQYPAQIVHINSTMDVAVLRVPGLTAARALNFSPDDPAVRDGIAAVGYCDAEGFLAGFSRIPAINAGRIRGTAIMCLHRRIRLNHLLVSCIGMKGMSGGPIISRRGTVGMMAGQEAGCTYSVHRSTILALLKRFAGFQQQAVLTMEEVIAQL